MSTQHDSPTGGLAIVTELSRRFAAADGAGALALFHPEIRIEQPQSLPHGGNYHGHSGVAAMASPSAGTGSAVSTILASSARTRRWCS